MSPSLLRRTPRARATQIAALIVALLTARLVTGDLSTLHRGARVFGAARPVVVARDDLDLGTRVRASDLRVVDLPAASVPPDTLTAPADALGRVVAVPVLSGAAVVGRALAPRRRGGLSTIVAPNRRAVRVVAADGLRPDPGSLVDIFATLDSRDVAGDVEPTVTVARSARVLSVDAAPSASAGDGGGANQRVGVVVLVTIAEAAHLADATTRGALMLALDPPEEACASEGPGPCR